MKKLLDCNSCLFCIHRYATKQFLAKKMKDEEILLAREAMIVEEPTP